MPLSEEEFFKKLNKKKDLDLSNLPEARKEESKKSLNLPDVEKLKEDSPLSSSVPNADKVEKKALLSG